LLPPPKKAENKQASSSKRQKQGNKQLNLVFITQARMIKAPIFRQIPFAFDAMPPFGSSWMYVYLSVDQMLYLFLFLEGFHF
jgi:hypothetical protein